MARNHSLSISFIFALLRTGLAAGVGEARGADRGPNFVIGFKSPHNKRGGDNLPERLRGLYDGTTTRTTPNCDIDAVYHAPLTKADKGRERGLSVNSVHLDYLRHIKGIDENPGRLLETLDDLELGDTPTCYGVRTKDAKLIVYPKHPKWTDACDLANDPYELTRLPADGPLATHLRAELAARMKDVTFTP